MNPKIPNPPNNELVIILFYLLVAFILIGLYIAS